MSKFRALPDKITLEELKGEFGEYIVRNWKYKYELPMTREEDGRLYAYKDDLILWALVMNRCVYDEDKI